MADDWKPGDLALCVSRNPAYPPAVEWGSLFMVQEVWQGVLNLNTGVLGKCFDLVGVTRWGDNCAYDPRRFRKIKPLTDEEREQFAADLNVREPVDA